MLSNSENRLGFLRHLTFFWFFWKGKRTLKCNDLKTVKVFPACNVPFGSFGKAKEHISTCLKIQKQYNLFTHWELIKTNFVPNISTQKNWNCNHLISPLQFDSYCTKNHSSCHLNRTLPKTLVHPTAKIIHFLIRFVDDANTRFSNANVDLVNVVIACFTVMIWHFLIAKNVSREKISMQKDIVTGEQLAKITNVMAITKLNVIFTDAKIKIAFSWKAIPE